MFPRSRENHAISKYIHVKRIENVWKTSRKTELSTIILFLAYIKQKLRELGNKP